jgi:hypothetical protein
MELFGYELKFDRKSKEDNTRHQSFVPEVHDDGAINVEVQGLHAGTLLDLDGTSRTAPELISRYRNMSKQSEVAQAVQAIVNDTIVQEEDKPIVEMLLDKLDDVLPDPIKDRLLEEFDQILDLLDFDAKAYEIFRRWYVDGQINYHSIIDPQRPKDGILEMRYVDPRKLRKVREILRKDVGNGVVINQTVKEYYFYSEKYVDPTTLNRNNVDTVGAKIAKDSIVAVTSGITDENDSMVLSYLHDAIKSLNQLRSMEDAAVIYRLVRAPSRRIFKVELGSLPRAKADQYLRNRMVQHKNRLVYDATSGDLRDDRRFMNMLDDYWIGVRDGKGDNIENLESPPQFGHMDEVLYFQKRLYKSLQVPISRLDPSDTSMFGRPSEMSRDEVAFSQFIDRLRLRFSQLFLKTLERQVVLKGIMSLSDWRKISKKIRFRYARNSYSEELKSHELMLARLDVAERIMPFVGRFVSNEFIRERIFMQSEEDRLKEDKKIANEVNNPQYPPWAAPGDDGLVPPTPDNGVIDPVESPVDTPKSLDNK